jgi:hypothetical protein
MKIAITGTDGGLGHAMKVEFSRNPHNTIIELNRPEHDLTKNLDSYLVPFDVFVNCAYSDECGFAQTELLYKLFEANKNKECHIINIGSVSGDGDRMLVYPYGVHKSSLEKACSQLSLVESSCKVSLIKPGRMKTRMTEHRSEYLRMDPSYVAAAAIWMVHQPKELNIKSLTIDVHNSNTKIS